MKETVQGSLSSCINKRQRTETITIIKQDSLFSLTLFTLALSLSLSFSLSLSLSRARARFHSQSDNFVLHMKIWVID